MALLPPEGKPRPSQPLELPVAGQASARPAPPLPVALFKALRPKQWVKNAVLLAGIVFTLDQSHPPGDWLRVLGAVAIFCMLSSAIYLVNDICDVEQDRLHPKKRFRPLAAGYISLTAAWSLAALLAVAGLSGAAALGGWFVVTAIAYVLLTVSYSFWLKHAVLMDVMALAGCYVVRAVAGAVVIGVEISPWLLVCTTLGALLVGLAKRRAELMTLENAASHRRILQEYTVQMLDQMISPITGATLMAYMLYTFFSKTAERLSWPWLMLTIPFVVYGIFRFFYLMHRHGKGGDPSVELVEDRNLMICALLWAVTCVLVMLLGR